MQNNDHAGYEKEKFLTALRKQALFQSNQHTLWIWKGRKDHDLWLSANTRHKSGNSYSKTGIYSYYNTYFWFKSPTDREQIQNSPFMNL